ncbi:MAG: flagellar basal body P-ring formation protein FlgA [Phycisphaeraceae bacterium]|nr:flagellar basal body P-ring formation protein FlgA [Phycisphaeraceae bacterium]
MTTTATHNLKHTRRHGRASRTAQVAFIVALVLIAAAAAAANDVIRVRDQAAVAGDCVKLGDVAALEGETAHSLAGVELVQLDKNQSNLDLTLDQIQDSLRKRGVNLAMLRISGFARCRVQRQAPAEAAACQADSCPRTTTVRRDATAELPPATTTPAIANPMQRVDVNTSVTMLDQVTAQLAQRAQAPLSAMTITFNDGDRQRLMVPVLDQKLEVEPLSGGTLGRIPLTVRRWRGQEMLEEIRVTADVSRTMLAVVAVKTLRKGQTIASGDVDVQEMMVRDDSIRPVQEAKKVIGQMALRPMRVGQIVDESEIDAPLMVHRGDLVTVRCLSGQLVVRGVARAVEDGAEGHVINLRNERSNQTFTGRVAAPREVVVIAEGNGL